MYQDDDGTLYAAAADLEDFPGTKLPEAAPAATSAAGPELMPHTDDFSV